MGTVTTYSETVNCQWTFTLGSSVLLLLDVTTSFLYKIFLLPEENYKELTKMKHHILGI